MSEALEIIASLYLPVTNGKLLLPNVSVAEVVAYQAPSLVTGKPDYYLGTFQWRGVSVPLISYELANDENAFTAPEMARIAVINSLGEQKDKLPFFAIVTQGIPRLIKISSNLIEPSDEMLGPADSAKVRVDGEEANIPNIAFLESLIYPHV